MVGAVRLLGGGPGDSGWLSCWQPPPFKPGVPAPGTAEPGSRSAQDGPVATQPLPRFFFLFLYRQPFTKHQREQGGRMKGAFSFFAQLLRDESVLRFGCRLQRASCSVPRVWRDLLSVLERNL